MLDRARRREDPHTALAPIEEAAAIGAHRAHAGQPRERWSRLPPKRGGGKRIRGARPGRPTDRRAIRGPWPRRRGRSADPREPPGSRRCRTPLSHRWRRSRSSGFGWRRAQLDHRQIRGSARDRPLQPVEHEHDRQVQQHGQEQQQADGQAHDPDDRRLGRRAIRKTVDRQAGRPTREQPRRPVPIRLRVSARCPRPEKRSLRNGTSTPTNAATSPPPTAIAIALPRHDPLGADWKGERQIARIGVETARRTSDRPAPAPTTHATTPSTMASNSSTSTIILRV